MDREERNDGLRELEDTYAGYEVRDPQGEKIGKVDDLFVDEADRPEYIGVKMGFLGLSGTTLIPAEITTADEERQVIEVSAEKDKVKEAPGFDDDQEITPEFEREIHEYYELEPAEGIEREPYGPYPGAEREVIAERARRGRPRGPRRTAGTAHGGGASGRYPRARGRAHERPQASTH